MSCSCSGVTAGAVKLFMSHTTLAATNSLDQLLPPGGMSLRKALVLLNMVFGSSGKGLSTTWIKKKKSALISMHPWWIGQLSVGVQRALATTVFAQKIVCQVLWPFCEITQSHTNTKFVGVNQKQQAALGPMLSACVLDTGNARSLCTVETTT